MTDLRDKLADAAEHGIDNVHDMDVTLRDYAEAAADAIIAALPGMVKPLEWEGAESDCFVICELDGRSYDLCVMDTLERPCDYLWSVTYYVGRIGTRIMCGEPATLEAAKSAANAHNRAQIVAALGIKL